jgi:hypothetical protein
MLHVAGSLRYILRLLHKLLVNGISSTIKRLLLQWALAAVSWARKVTSRLIQKRKNGHRTQQQSNTSKPEDNITICYSQEPKIRFQLSADEATSPVEERASESLSSHMGIELDERQPQVVSPEIEPQAYRMNRIIDANVSDKLLDAKLWFRTPEQANLERYDGRQYAYVSFLFIHWMRRLITSYI